MFSIGIPAFKSQFLKECIDSILTQTHKDFELIIVNDCSPDSIDNIVGKYTDSRIRYYKNEINFGAEHVVDNWNKCLNYAQGEYFILMGDDDKMESNYLEEFIVLINKYPDLDVYHCRSKIIDENSNEIRLVPACPEFERTEDYILECIKRRREQFISDFVFRVNSLRLNGGFYKLPLAWWSDYLSIFISSSFKGIAGTNKILFNYRSNQFNITNTGCLELKRLATITIEDWLSTFVKNNNGCHDTVLQEINITLKKMINESKISFMRQLIGRNVFNALTISLTKRKKYRVSIKDFFGATLISLTYKISRIDI